MTLFEKSPVMGFARGRTNRLRQEVYELRSGC